MLKAGRELSEGHEHESALGHARMWNFNILSMNNFYAIKQNVEIDNSRPARDQLFAPKQTLNPLQRGEQLFGRQWSLRFDNAIQEPRLCEKIHGFSLIN